MIYTEDRAKTNVLNMPDLYPAVLPLLAPPCPLPSPTVIVPTTSGLFPRAPSQRHRALDLVESGTGAEDSGCMLRLAGPGTDC